MNKNEYLKIEQIIHIGEGSEMTEANVDKFMDFYFEIVEKFNWTAAGSYKLMTEKEVLFDEF